MIIDDILSSHEEIEFLKADGFDEAIIGFDLNSERLIYDVELILGILLEEGLTEEDALEHFYYNIAGSYMGEKTPIYLTT